MTLEHEFESATQAHNEFERCWIDPNATRFELPPIGVNETLATHYITPGFKFTRSMIWDMQCRKALDPSTYVPYVISQAGIYARRHLADGCDHFIRWPIQKAWLSEQRGRVIESIYIDHSSQKITFLGIAETKSEDGRTVTAADYQPLVHVEHAAGGSEYDPYNLWKIVFLTHEQDERYTQPFEKMASTGVLPAYLEIYAKRDQNVDLIRR